MPQDAVGGAFGEATNQELSEAFPPKPRHPAQKQSGLQIAERRGKILGELSIAGSILTTIAQMTDTETVMNLPFSSWCIQFSVVGQFASTLRSARVSRA